MANPVNPPPLLRIPKAFLNDGEVRAFIEQQNTIIFQLWNRTGGVIDIVGGNAEGVEENAANILINSGLIADNTGAISDNTDLINEIPTYSGFMAQIQFLQRQFDGLPEFTIDTSGFTTDTTFITTDKVIA